MGITFSEITLAESATVVLYASEHASSVSLLPTTYIAIIPKSSIVPRMTHKRYTETADQRRRHRSFLHQLYYRTEQLDIEMDLVVGVHGPVKAAYILVNDR